MDLHHSPKTEILSHEEIVKQFLGSKAVDFQALGRFIAQHGESIAVSGRGDYGVRIGYYNILACFKIAPRALDAREIGLSDIAADVIGH